MMIPLFDFEGDGIRFDLPGPYSIEWSRSTARNRLQRRREIAREVIPVATGIAFAAAPFVIGSALVAFAPHPGLKMAGASMMIPTGVGEVFWFGVGYGVGTQIEQHIPDWML
jgi:hypothetical protein